MNSPAEQTVAVLFSGGLDSAILVAHLLAEGQRVQPLYIDGELHWQPVELRWARRFLQALTPRQPEKLVVLRMPLSDLYADHWSITGRGVPGAEEPDERVYLPGRNPLLLAKAQVWCQLHGVRRLALGALGSNPFADATDEFFASFEEAMNRAVSGQVELVRPLAQLDKRQVMQLESDAPLQLTFSCLAPRGELHCGACNKCAERQLAFRQAGLVDPTPYATAARKLAI